MTALPESLQSVGRDLWAGNEPCFENWPAVTFWHVAGGFEMLSNPVEGFPGMNWFPPGGRALQYRNVRVWPHPSRHCVWLMEPLPDTVSDAHWKRMDLTEDPAGTALYYRGWIKQSIDDNRFERFDPPEGREAESSGLSLLGHPFAW